MEYFRFQFTFICSDLIRADINDPTVPNAAALGLSDCTCGRPVSVCPAGLSPRVRCMSLVQPLSQGNTGSTDAEAGPAREVPLSTDDIGVINRQGWCLFDLLKKLNTY